MLYPYLLSRLSDHKRVSHAHARPRHPAALAFVPYGIVLIRVRTRCLYGLCEYCRERHCAEFQGDELGNADSYHRTPQWGLAELKKRPGAAAANYNYAASKPPSSLKAWPWVAGPTTRTGRCFRRWTSGAVAAEPRHEHRHESAHERRERLQLRKGRAHHQHRHEVRPGVSQPGPL